MTKMLAERDVLKKRIDILILDNTVITFAYSLNSCRCFVWCKRCKQDKLTPLCVCSAYIVLRILECTANTLMGILVQVTMKLKNIIRCNRNVFIVFVNSIQYKEMSPRGETSSIYWVSLVTAHSFAKRSKIAYHVCYTYHSAQTAWCENYLSSIPCKGDTA